MMNPRLRKLIGTRIEERSIIWLQQARELAASLLTEESESLTAAKLDSGEGEA